MAEVFADTEGFSFMDVPRSLERSQLRPIRIAIRGKGRILDSHIQSLLGKQGASTAALIAIEPTPPSTAMDLFGAVLESTRGLGTLSRAVGGQAYRLDAGSTEVLFSPVAVEPYLLLLVVTGGAADPNEALARAILEASSA